MRGKLVAIVGPTAVGKTHLAFRLARDVGGEVVSADSRQIYRYLDIGTAKPSPEERAQVPHHLVDVVDPDQPLTLAMYQDMALRAIGDILNRGKVPLLVGGTGLYIRAVADGFLIPRVPPNLRWRKEWEEQAKREGVGTLYRQLQELDPQAAQRIDPRNLRRVIRALEVCKATGIPFSALRGSWQAPFRVQHIGLTMDRERLYQRIDRRVDRMMEKGLLEEVRGLLAEGYSPDLPALSGLGYRQLIAHLRGELSLQEAVRRIKRDTRRYVRQQYNWFRLSDRRIRWFNVEGTPYETIRDFVLGFLLEADPIDG